MKGTIKIGHWYSFPKYIIIYLNDKKLFHCNDDGEFYTKRGENWTEIVRIQR